MSNPVRRTSWEVSVAEKVLVRVWADHYESSHGGHEIQTWMEVFDATIPRGSTQFRTRLVSRLVTGANLNPELYTTGSIDPTGKFRQQAVFDFVGDLVSVRFRDGTSIQRPLTARPLVVVGQNLLPHLAALVEQLEGRCAQRWDAAYFSPETLQEVPYRLVRVPTGFVSNQDENLSTDGTTLNQLTISSLSVEATRRSLPRPPWTRLPTDETPPEPKEQRPRHSVRVAGHVAESHRTLRDDGHSLGYCVATPSDRTPTATMLFIGGSGAHDRDGGTATYHLGYADLLRRLAKRGIASVRYDTRGAGSTRLGEDLLNSGLHQRVGDAQRMLAELRQLDADAQPVIMGHSEGGLIGLILAAQGSLAGLVLASTAARPIDQVIRQQIRAAGKRDHLPDSLIGERIARFDELVSVALSVPDERWSSESVPDRVYPLRTFAGYLREAVPLNPVQLLSSLSCPVLIIQGDADLQVPADDALRLERAAHRSGLDVSVLIVPGANHLLRSSSTPPAISDYFDRRRRVVPHLVATVARWCEQLPRAEGTTIDD